MFKLIRDNIPAILTNEGGHLNYAAAQGEDFFKSLLKGKLIEEVNEYLASGDSLEELVDIKTVLDYLIGERFPEFNQLFEQKFKEHGGFENRFIGFFPDLPAENTRNVNTQTPAKNN
jgi:predicted house-cleaning noncanonical NTP pyrophosphatase (MazG superfamily)